MRKLLESREFGVRGQNGQHALLTEFGKVQKREIYSNRKGTPILFSHSQRLLGMLLVCTLQHGVHPEFIFLLAVQRRLATMERLKKCSIHIIPDCIFYGRDK